MRLLIVGTMKGQLILATKMAVERGASVVNAETVDQGARCHAQQGRRPRQ